MPGARHTECLAPVPFQLLMNAILLPGHEDLDRLGQACVNRDATEHIASEVRRGADGLPQEREM